MARTKQQQQSDDEEATEPSPDSLVPPLPDDFEFHISENVPIPAQATAQRPSQHAFARLYDSMGHNSTFFVPLAYWLKRGRTAENTPFTKQKDIIGITFQAWKKKGTEDEQAAKKKWRLVIVKRDLGEDPEYPNMTGVRAWKVDTSR